MGEGGAGLRVNTPSLPKARRAVPGPREGIIKYLHAESNEPGLGPTRIGPRGVHSEK